MQNKNKVIEEAKRQISICNACRYCEGYCAVFPQMFEKKNLVQGDVMQLANLCHNCRSCYYACQYTQPHEFAINIPAILAETRHESWKEFAFPKKFAQSFERGGTAISIMLVIAFTFLFWLISAFNTGDGEGFYGILSHQWMVVIFTPAFCLPLLMIAISLKRYWRAINHHEKGRSITIAHAVQLFKNVATMHNLKGGHNQGCNFEKEDQFTHARRIFHQMTLWGFMMCFASTSVGTMLHYVWQIEAPYSWYSVPKLLGVPGGILLCLGSAGLAWLKIKADPNLGYQKIWAGEMAFILLLFGVSFTGLVLYAVTGTPAVKWLLPTHLSTVLVFFLLMPYSKMMHGFYRLMALLKNTLSS